jgi:hypothetical protein
MLLKTTRSRSLLLLLLSIRLLDTIFPLLLLLHASWRRLQISVIIIITIIIICCCCYSWRR